MLLLENELDGPLVPKQCCLGLVSVANIIKSAITMTERTGCTCTCKGDQADGQEVKTSLPSGLPLPYITEYSQSKDALKLLTV